VSLIPLLSRDYAASVGYALSWTGVGLLPGNAWNRVLKGARFALSPG